MDNRRVVNSLHRERCVRAKVKVKGGVTLLDIPTQFSHDGKWIFVCCGKVVEVCSRATRQVVCVLEHHSAPITGMCLNDLNPLQLMTSSLDGQLVLWDYTDGAVLKSVDFGVPLLKFGLRIGQQEPSLFFTIATGASEVAVVGVARACLTERSPATSPSQQLQASQHLMTCSVPRDFYFTCKGQHLVSSTGTGRKLLVYNFEKEQKFRYKCNRRLTAVACHPSLNCIATGNNKGEIFLWYDFGENASTDEVTTTLHWHAHAVGHLCFTTDGTYLLSGGEEGVLVLWTVKTNHKQFRPRLSAPITRLACAPGDAYFTVSLQCNVIQVVSGMNLVVEGYLGGIRTAWLSPQQNGMKTGLVLCPNSKSLVLNSTPGVLQFYDTATRKVTELNVTSLNAVSRTDVKALVHTSVDHVAFSPSGDWMATVESRDDGQTAPELRMKFWQFFTKWQKYVVNTCVDPPHNKRVTSLRFQPPTAWRGRSNPHSGSNRRWNGTETSCIVAVTTSLDGKFKIWVLVSDEPLGREEEDKGDKRQHHEGRRSLWACRSAGYLQELTCEGCSFSEDGSLLAVNFSKVLTLWDPFQCELKKKFASLHEETFKQVEFGCCSSSQYLLATSSSCLQVWDMLSCTEVWRVTVCAPVLVVSPYSSLAAVFMRSEEEDVHLYLVDPSCHAPLCVHSTPCLHPIIGAEFVPCCREDGSKTDLSGRNDDVALYFMDETQTLYSLEQDSIEPDSGTSIKTSRTKLVVDEPSYAQKAFTDIFGKRKRLNGQHPPSAAATPPLSQVYSSLLSAPPHVLPPPSSLCSHFMRLLLPPQTHLVDTSTRDTPKCSLDEVQDVLVTSDEETMVNPKKLCKTPGSPGGSYRDRSRTTTHLHSSSSSYHWLVDYFRSTT